MKLPLPLDLLSAVMSVLPSDNVLTGRGSLSRAILGRQAILELLETRTFYHARPRVPVAMLAGLMGMHDTGGTLAGLQLF